MIFNNVVRSRFEQEEDGKLVIANYSLRDGIYALMHVEADSALRGTGAAGRFMTALMDHAREHHLMFTPYCSYARVWFKRHTDAADLITKT